MLTVKTQLVPTLREGDVVILDNLSSHKSPAAAKALRDIGAWFLFLPTYSPDLNPIEMAFSKLKALIRKAKTETAKVSGEMGVRSGAAPRIDCYKMRPQILTGGSRHASLICASGGCLRSGASVE